MPDSESARKEALFREWKQEEDIAHIHGWDFSHLSGRYTEETDLPWNFADVIAKYVKPESRLLDMETGGGEFLLSLHHAPSRTAATEGYPPNVEVCKERLLPLGIDFQEADGTKPLPFADRSFDVITNRHGDFVISELSRTLAPGGVFLTEQVGEDNDRELIELLLPGTPKAYPGLNLQNTAEKFQNAGFSVLESQEAFRPIRFYDVGALVWFARVLPWEFPGFSVESCFENLWKAQRLLDGRGVLEGRIHRFWLAVQLSPTCSI